MEFMEALLLIKNTCETVGGCANCPFGKYLGYKEGYTCGIVDCQPSDWKLGEKTIVRYFKEDKSAE